LLVELLGFGALMCCLLIERVCGCLFVCVFVKNGLCVFFVGFLIA
jgi:hypothetical protein